MDLREILHLDRLQRDQGAKRPDGTDPKKFQALLDEMQKLTSDQRSQESTSTDLGEFADELRRADDDYATLMDIRNKLEEAFRRQIP